MAKSALFMQKTFFHDMINDQVQETLLFIAEALILVKEYDEALEKFNEVLDAREGGFGSFDNKDIYRKQAFLFTNKQMYLEAADCLQKVVAAEDQDLVKVGLLTKIAGNYKKANKRDECVKASTQAYGIMSAISGQDDAQTQKCRLNLASVHQYFEENEEALKMYQ